MAASDGPLHSASWSQLLTSSCGSSPSLILRPLHLDRPLLKPTRSTHSIHNADEINPIPSAPQDEPIPSTPQDEPIPSAPQDEPIPSASQYEPIPSAPQYEPIPSNLQDETIMDYANVPTVVFSHPPLAVMGAQAEHVEADGVWIIDDCWWLIADRQLVPDLLVWS